MALRLRAKGIEEVRPLLGGVDAWVALGYPLEGPVRAPAPLSDPAALAIE